MAKNWWKKTIIDEDFAKGIPDEEVKKYHELGLGRGVDVTDPHMWKNKSSILVRKIACTPELNIVTTNESGIKEEYLKEVSSFEVQQQSIKLSLDDPTNRFKIGMDAHYSKSATSSTLIAGTKIETRTISFTSDFRDIPLYTSKYTLSFDMPPDTESSDCAFERQLCSWILQRIRDRQIKNSEVPDQSLSENGENPIERLTTVFQRQLESSDPEEKDKKVEKAFSELRQDCKEFLMNLGITHYVSSIELGALAYSSKTIKSQQKEFKGGVEASVEGAAKGGISGLYGRGKMHKEQHKKFIGHLNVDEDPSGEAVIGFHIQPIDVLVRSQFLNWALRRDIKEYIQLKTDKSEGPFLISCKVDEQPVYWMVDKKEKSIMGTLSINLASLFYIKPAGNPSHPCDLLILHYGDHKHDRKILMHVADPHVKWRLYESLLPYYVSTNATSWGSSDKPLQLKMSAEVSRIQFTLHDRVQSSFACFMCRSTPVSMSSWLEGEQFYIKCSQHSLKIDGYIAMKKTSEDCPDVYQTVTVLGIKEHEQGAGMLFRLHPKEYKILLPPTLRKTPAVEGTDGISESTSSFCKSRSLC